MLLDSDWYALRTFENEPSWGIYHNRNYPLLRIWRGVVARQRPDDLLGKAGPMKEVKIRLIERLLGGELTAHLGYEDGNDAPADQTKRRNGPSSKVLKGQDGAFPISVPRSEREAIDPVDQS